MKKHRHFHDVELDWREGIEDEIREWVRANRMRGWRIIDREYYRVPDFVVRFADKRDATLFKLFWC